MKKILQKLIANNKLEDDDLKKIILYLEDSNSEDIVISSFISLLKAKGINTDEFILLVKHFRPQPLLKLKTSLDRPVIDIVGTGGDGANTLNISTTSAIITAACGVKVAKHGNRSVSSKCGSADLLDKWGISLDCNKESLMNCLSRVGITFLSAPHFNPLMKRVAPIRKALGFPSCFNYLGPFLNPCQLSHILLGVADIEFMETAIMTLKEQGFKRAMVVNCCGLDELATIGKNEYYELTNGLITRSTLDPLDYGFAIGELSDLMGDDVEYNSQVLEDVLKAIKTDENLVLRETLILNSGCALYLVDKCPTIKAGCEMARQLLDSSLAYDKLVEWRNYIN